MKNALANDNGKDAASAGNAFVTSMDKMDKNSLTADKKKKWEDLADDAKEMAEHIGKNASDILGERPSSLRRLVQKAVSIIASIICFEGS